MKGRKIISLIGHNRNSINKDGGQGFYWRERRRRGILMGATITVGGGIS